MFTKCAPKESLGNTYYPLFSGDKVYIAISGNEQTSYSLSIGNKTEGNRDRNNEVKTIHIPVYDSPNMFCFLNKYCKEHEYPKIEENLPNRYLDSEGNKYNYSVDFFKNYLKALGDNKVVFTIGIRDVYFDKNDYDYDHGIIIYNDELSGYAPQNGAKLTDTVIGFQIEFDGGLYTGRQKNSKTINNIEISAPILKAERFSRTVTVFYNALYNSSITFGMYPGGPNEQGFTTDIIESNNNNQHSYKNHVVYIPRNNTEGEYGDGKKYMEFWDTIGGENYQNHNNSYTGSLILDTIRGVANNVWADNAQSYYAGLLSFSNNGQLLNN